MVANVLDASAVIALIQWERGCDVVARAVQAGAAISAVNACEVLSKSSEQRVDVQTLERRLMRLKLDIVPFTMDDSREAAHLRAPTSFLGLSLGDRACLALGRRLGVPVLTADRPWSKLDPSFRVTVIR